MWTKRRLWNWEISLKVYLKDAAEHKKSWMTETRRRNSKQEAIVRPRTTENQETIY